MTLQDERVQVPVRARGRLLVAVLAIAGFAMLLAGLAGWAWLGNHPELGLGSTGKRPDSPMRVANDGIEDTRYVLDGDGKEGALLFGLRNDGPVTFTVLGLQPPSAGAAYGIWTGLQLKAVGQQEGYRWDQARAGEVEVAPGEEVAVVLRARLPRCAPWGGGTGMTADSVDLRIRQLGITTTQQLPLPLPLLVRTAHDLPAAPGPGCRSPGR